MLGDRGGCFQWRALFRETSQLHKTGNSYGTDPENKDSFISKVDNFCDSLSSPMISTYIMSGCRTGEGERCTSRGSRGSKIARLRARKMREMYGTKSPSTPQHSQVLCPAIYYSVKTWPHNLYAIPICLEL